MSEAKNNKSIWTKMFVSNGNVADASPAIGLSQQRHAVWWIHGRRGIWTRWSAPPQAARSTCPHSCLSPRCVRPSSSSPARTRSCPGATFPFLAIHRAPRRHGVVEQQSEHVGAASHSGRVEHVRDAVLTLAEDEQWVPLQ